MLVEDLQHALLIWINNQVPSHKYGAPDMTSDTSVLLIDKKSPDIKFKQKRK